MGMQFGFGRDDDEFAERVVYVDRPRKKGKGNPNPNPYNFEIKERIYEGKYAALKVRYPDATTYEGNKILVVEMTKEELRKADKLDPHFFPEGPVVARFKPGRQGWRDAIAYLKTKSGS